MADVTRNPGWYPDPDGGGAERWWNGAGWSDTRRAKDGSPVAVSSPVAASPLPPRPNPYAPPLPVQPYAPASPYPPTAAPPAYPVATGTSPTTSVNRNAMIGFVFGLIALFFNVLFVLAPLAVVFSVLGIIRARQLKAEGVASNNLVFAVIGLLTGALGMVVGLFQIIFLIAGFMNASGSTG